MTKTTDEVRLGQRIQIRLDELGWKQSDLLARVPGLGKGTLSAMIVNNRVASEWSDEIAEALGVEHRWLQKGVEPKLRQGQPVGASGERFTKRDAADRLIARARHLIENEHDVLCAIVLAGAAEDLLAELIDPTGKGSVPAARRGLAEASAKLLPGASPEQFRERMRDAYNWLRHSGKQASAPAITLDAEQEARDILDRATDNYWTAFGALPPAIGT